MWKNRSLFQKNILSVFFLILLALSTCCVMIVHYEYKDKINESIQESRELSECLNEAMQEYVDKIEGAVASCYYELYRDQQSPLATLLAENRELSALEKVTIKNELNSFFSRLFIMNYDFIDVYLYSDEGVAFLYSPMAQEVFGYSPEQSEWYQQTLKKNGKTHMQLNYIPEHTKYKKPVLGISRMIKSLGVDIKENTVILLDFSMKNFETILDKYMLDDTTTVIFTNDSGEVIYQKGMDLGISNIKELNLEEDSTKESIRNIDGNSYCIIQSVEKVYEWNVLYITNQQYVIEKIKDYICFIIGVLILVGIAITVLAYWIVHSMYRPIRELKAGMQQVKEGNFDAALTKKTNDEFGMLIEDFNEMAVEIKRLIKERYEEELEKKDAQFQFLQAQMDPHFIFNTLQIISSMAIVNNNLEIEKVSNSLARLIRSSLAGEQKLILLSDEVKNVISYLEIQKIRFKNRLSYEINCDKRLENRYIIKLILQPIVENAIYHGIEVNGKQGFIRIDIYQEDEKIYLIIKDNGKGMCEQELERVMKYVNISLSESKTQQTFAEHETRAKGNSVGLRNINLRLKMYYGDEYGLSIRSQIGEGTTVAVCIRAESKG